MRTSDSDKQTHVLGEILLRPLLRFECKQPLGKIGWMSAVLGITEDVEAYLADPELKLMIVEEPLFEVEAQSITNFQIAKKKRPDVAFIVSLSTGEEEGYAKFRAAGADHVVCVHERDFVAHLAQLVDSYFSN